MTYFSLRQWLCVYFVTAWPAGSLWHNWPQHPNNMATRHFWLFWHGPLLVYLPFKLAYPVSLLVMNQPQLFWNVECRVVLFWDRFHLLCIYTFTPFKYRYLSVRSFMPFMPFLCRWFPASQIKCSFWLSSSCLLFEKGAPEIQSLLSLLLLLLLLSIVCSSQSKYSVTTSVELQSKDC